MTAAKQAKTQEAVFGPKAERRFLDVVLLNYGTAQTRYAEEVMSLRPEFVCGLVIKSISDLPGLGSPVFVCAANGRKKAAAYAELGVLGVHTPPPLIHPLAGIGMRARVSNGCIVNPFARLGPEAFIGFGCMIHAHCVIEHDCRIGQFCNLSPAAVCNGGVVLGEYVNIYAGAVIYPSITIGEGAIIHANAVVRSNVPAGECWAGNPARRVAMSKEARDGDA